MKFEPTDAYAHDYQPSRFIGKARLLVDTMLEGEEQATIRTLLQCVGTAMQEILHLREHAGYRDTGAKVIEANRKEMYRAATGEEWIERARKAGL